VEFRCDNKKFGEFIPELDAVDFKCSAGHCGKEAGVVVIHRFFLDGRPMETRRYREPPRREVTQQRGSDQNQPALRYAGHRAQGAD
jgi:hypothetical protein